MRERRVSVHRDLYYLFILYPIIPSSYGSNNRQKDIVLMSPKMAKIILCLTNPQTYLSLSNNFK